MLSDTQIRDKVINGELEIKNISDLDSQLTSSGLDLRVDSDYRRPATDEVFDTNMSKSDSINLRPGEFYQIHTIETVSIPDDLHVETKSKHGHNIKGLDVLTGVVYPGYNGSIVIGVTNKSEDDIYITPGDEIITLTFTELDEPSEVPYDERKDSQYQNQTGI